MKKFLLSFGAIATAMTPIVAVVSCGDEDTNAQKMLNKVTDIYATGDLTAAKTAVASLAADAEITNATLAIGPNLSSAFTADQSDDTKYTLKYYMTVKGAEVGDSLSVKVKVVEGKDVSMAEKTLTLKFDAAKPTFEVNTTDAVEGQKIVKDTTTPTIKGKITYAATTDTKEITVDKLAALITPKDAEFKMLTLEYKWGAADSLAVVKETDLATTKFDLKDATTATATKNYQLTIKAEDGVGNNETYTLDVQVTYTAP